MNEEWIKAPESVLKLADELIALYHEPLLSANIGFVFRATADRSGEKLVLGKAAKVSPRDKVYNNLDFIIWLAQDWWMGILTDHQRRALLDHELCHCKFDEESETFKIRPHDIEEFQEIIERYGLWDESLRSAGRTLAVAAQGYLPGFDTVVTTATGKRVALDPAVME